jgi:hypothetical protein
MYVATLNTDALMQYHDSVPASGSVNSGFYQDYAYLIAYSQIMKEFYNPMSSLGSNPSLKSSPFYTARFYTQLLLFFILPAIPLEPRMQHSIASHSTLRGIHVTSLMLN